MTEKKFGKCPDCGQENVRLTSKGKPYANSHECKKEKPISQLKLFSGLISVIFVGFLGYSFFVDGSFKFMTFLNGLGVFVILLAILLAFLERLTFKDAVTVVATCVVAIFAINQYLITVPYFYTDGTESCGYANNDYNIFSTGKEGVYFVQINDLNFRHEGTRSGFIKVELEILPKELIDEKQIVCRDCNSLTYVKPDGEGNKTQTTNFILWIQENVRNFSFKQKVFLSDFIFYTNNFQIRECSCKVDLDQNKLFCEDIKQ